MNLGPPDLLPVTLVFGPRGLGDPLRPARFPLFALRGFGLLLCCFRRRSGLLFGRGGNAAAPAVIIIINVGFGCTPFARPLGWGCRLGLIEGNSLLLVLSVSSRYR